MAAGKVRIAGVVRSVIVAVAVVAIAPAGCRSRQRADPERALAKKRADLLAGNRAIISSPQAVGEPACPAPRLQIGAAGVTVSIYPSTGLRGRWTGPPPSRSAARVAEPSIWEQVVVPRTGVCPSVPRRDGHLDDAALVSLLREIVAARPPCPPPRTASPDEDERTRRLFDAIQSGPDTHVIVVPGDETAMDEITEVVDAAAAAGLPGVRFLDEREPPSCAGAITPDVLRARLASWRYEQ